MTRLWLLGLAWMLAAVAAASAGELRVLISVNGNLVTEPIEGRLSVRRVDLPEAAIESFSVQVPGESVLPLGAAGVLALTLDTSGFWMPDKVVRLGSEGGEAALLVHPTGIVEGALQPPRGTGPPDRLRARFRSAPNTEPFLGQHWIRCDLAERKFRCEIPSGNLDLGLRSPGYVTIYRWGVEVPVHKELKLGTLSLRKGASIVGWVRPPGRDFRYEDVEVSISPLSLGFGAAGDHERRDARFEGAAVNTRGFFEFPQVEPGSYRLTVEHPEYAPYVLSPVEVHEGSETEIRWVDLWPPVGLTLRISPEHDPFQRPWRVGLSRQGLVPGHWEEVQEKNATAEGLVEASRLAPGRFQVEVRDSSGSLWHSELVELTTSTSSEEREIRLPYERLEGLVTLGEEPLKGARLYFGGKHGAESVRDSTDEEGKFYVFLPERQGSWKVDIEKLDLDLFTRVEGVQVEKMPGEPWAYVEIELPATRLEGRTVDEQGRPLPGVDVSISAPGEVGFQVRSTSPEGRFVARGRRAGSWTLEARASVDGQLFSSGVVRVQVSEDIEPLPVELVLRRDIELTGQVIAPSGEGVPGAMVLPLLEQPDRNLANTDRRTYTDASGVFRLRLPGAAGGVQLTVFPPGFAASQVRTRADRDGPVLIPVEAAGGTVRVILDSEDTELPPRALARTYLMGEYWLGFSGFLRQWAQAHGIPWSGGGEMVVPALDPGPYTVCFDTPEVAYLGRLSPPSSASCASGVLEPFGELILHLPVKRKNQDATEGP